MSIVGLLALAYSVAGPKPLFLLWNASASVPIGLYIVQPNREFRVGALAVTHLPPAAEQLAASRRYLPNGVLLIKPVAATAGTTVCRIGAGIHVNGRWTALAQTRDRMQREMPAWSGCQVLSSRQIFLLNPAVPDSFDGRYFGPIDTRLTVGRAFPLLTFPDASRP